MRCTTAAGDVVSGQAAAWANDSDPNIAAACWSNASCALLSPSFAALSTIGNARA